MEKPPAPLSRPPWRTLLGICALSLGLEVLAPAHGHFGFDGFFGFNAVLALASCAGLAVLGRLLGRLVKRPEDYYDR